MHSHSSLLVLSCLVVLAFVLLSSSHDEDMNIEAMLASSAVALTTVHIPHALRNPSKGKSQQRKAVRAYAGGNIPPEDMPLVPALRSVNVVNTVGEKYNLGEMLSGKGVSLVVVLGNLACPYGWAVAKEWSRKSEELLAMGVKGPIFLSMGDSHTLSKFLELNPDIDGSRAYVYDTLFTNDPAMEVALYEMARLNHKGNQQMPMDKLNIQVPNLTFEEWQTLTNHLKELEHAPQYKQKDVSIERLGGTFVLKDDRVVYGWADRIPGDLPELDQVFNGIVHIAAKSKRELEMLDTKEKELKARMENQRRREAMLKFNGRQQFGRDRFDFTNFLAQGFDHEKEAAKHPQPFLDSVTREREIERKKQMEHLRVVVPNKSTSIKTVLPERERVRVERERPERERVERERVLTGFATLANWREEMIQERDLSLSIVNNL